jgi:hypothetical protein
MKIELLLGIFGPRKASMVIQCPEQCDGEGTQQKETSQHHHQHVLKPVGACPFVFIFIMTPKTREKTVILRGT